MKVRCVKRSFGFQSNCGNFYFIDEDGNNYYWYSSSDKAYEMIKEGKEIILTSFKNAGKFTMDGIEYVDLKNVRFKEV